MKDYKQFYKEAAGEGFGKDVENYKKGSKLLKTIQSDNRIEKTNQAKSQAAATKKEIPDMSEVKPAGVDKSKARRDKRTAKRSMKLNDIKRERGQKLKSRVTTGVNMVKNAIQLKGSTATGSTSGTDTTERGVKYQ